MPAEEVKLRITTDSTAAVAGLKKVSDGLGGLQAMAGRATALLGAYFSVDAIKGLADMGVQALRSETAFKNATDQLAIDGKRWVETLKEASRGTIDESDLMQKAMKGITGGLSQEQITKIAEMSTTAAIRMGTDVKAAYEDIIDAVEMMKTKTLVRYGLITKAQFEIVESAKQAGEQVDIFRVIMENAANQQALVGSLDETSLAFQRAKAASQDFWESIGKEVAGVIGQVYTVGRLVKNLFSETGREENRRAAEEKLGRMAMDETYLYGPYGSAYQKLPTPYTDSLKGAEARRKAADEARRQAEMIRKVIDNLNFEYDQMQRVDREQAIATALRQANVTATSAQGQQIAELTGRNYDYLESQKQTRAEAEAWTKNFKENAIEREKLLESIAAEVSAIEQEVDMFTMSERQASLYRLAIKGATEEQLAFADSLLTAKERLKEVLDVTESLKTPQEKYTESVEKYKRLLDNFSITWDQYTEGMKQAKEALDAATKDQADQLSELQKAIEGWGKESADAIVDFALTGKESFSDMTTSIIADIMKMLVYQQMLKPLFSYLGTSVPGWFTPSSTPAGYSIPSSVTPAASQAASSVAAGPAKSVVNVYNNAGADVSAQSRETPSGVELDIMIDRAVASKLGTFGSATNKTMRQNFTTSQRLINR